MAQPVPGFGINLFLITKIKRRVFNNDLLWKSVETPIVDRQATVRLSCSSLPTAIQAIRSQDSSFVSPAVSRRSLNHLEGFLVVIFGQGS